ncbi:hypothetical protein NYO98_02240 [Nocardioides sp. STR2]|jgi:hypothetical protein|uniref:Uncharacterized protein n=1 Tax=Nocardioides pini TaxID=2975053 RepID=A0ABT4C800_9ACTN|nr:hypothetical protein [Nocardioides pini]MCY4725080.1 hypothetical protein [Nocardioides pini]
MAGLVVLVLCTLMLGAAVGLALCQAEIGRAVRRVRAHLSPPPPAPSAPAIEEVAAALRRVRREVLAPVPGTPMARRRGTMAAYDDLLGQAARALGVTDLVTDLREGTDREAERLRLEHLLREAGLVIDQPRSDRR